MKPVALRCAAVRRLRICARSATATAGIVAVMGLGSVSAMAGTDTVSAPLKVGYTQTSATVDLARTVRLDSLPQATRAELAAHPQPMAPRNAFDAKTWAAKKARAALGSADPAAIMPPPVTPAVGRETPSAPAIFQGPTDANCGCAPGDQALAVGTKTIGVIQAVNTAISVFNTSGVLQPGYPKSFDTFFGLAAGRATSDPRAIYDWINHRYILVMIDYDSNNANAANYNLAFSTADDPTGSYNIYRFPVQTVAPSGGVFPLPDFPRIGQDRFAVYLASNIFNPNFAGEELVVFNKAQGEAGKVVTLHSFGNLTVGGVQTDTTQPVNISDPADFPRAEYLVTSKNFTFPDPKNGLIVWSLKNPTGTPSLTAVSVATANNYSTPPSASQPGGANDIDTNDTRISGSPAYRAGSIYAAINSANGSHSESIVYEIQPFVNTSANITGARILNEIVFGNPNADVYYATQQPDPEGNVTTVFNYSDSSSVYPSLGFQSRRAGQATGSFPDGGLLAIQGQAFYPFGRWGDYTAVAPGNLFGAVTHPQMWFAGMYARSGGGWGSAIGYNGYTSVGQP